MDQNKKFKLVSSKKTRYLLPNILTLGGVCLGISSIKFSIDGNYNLAVTLILLAAILDALDGRIARLIKGTSEFGKELDSLTDFVSFGIAPVFILYFWELNNYGKLGWAIALIYSVCCVLRLARLNIKSLTPYFTVLVALLLVSKIPTLSFKKISISSKTTIFLLLFVGLIFISLLFYTFETLLAFGLIYLISVPISVVIFKKQQKKFSEKISDEDHEDVL